METRAPYLAPAGPAAQAAHGTPEPPRNLTAPLAAWLRQQGFATSERLLPTLATIEANWQAPSGERFCLTYTWAAAPHGQSSCRLQVQYPGVGQPETLLAAQHARSLGAACWLLLSNLAYANARLHATLRMRSD